MNLLDQTTVNTSPGPCFEKDSDDVRAPNSPLVRLIAFYLPQFHAIPENDLWWGTGFTEWTNVTKAIPRFTGHYQPRLPGALGFYDATRPEILKHQAAMAKKYGIGGFCFHYYWFNGRQVLERPLESLLANPDIDLPFCVNWANESWTRRWDSDDENVLIKQEHSVEDDLAFARSLEVLFQDKRYIRINGRPLLLIYRPALFPDMRKTVERWRRHFKSAGFGDPYISMVQTLGAADAESYGMDAAVGFPPFWTCFDLPMRKDLKLLDPKFYGVVRDYRALADSVIDGYRHDKRVFPGVVPSWDNEARRPQRGICFTGSEPSAYGRWLTAACVASMRAFAGEERLVFINAWNEWAEGAYLEPDRHYGFAYLAETRRVLNTLAPELVNTFPTNSIAEWSAPKLTFNGRIRRMTRQSLNIIADWAEAIVWKLRGR